VKLAIKEADVILLVVDVNEGVTQFDMEVAHLLRQAKKETV
jgi:GTP-binding protein